jgi:hypothetical protein
MDASRRVRFAANDADDGELGADSPVGWTPMASLDAARARESDDDDDDDGVTVDASTPTRTDATVAASHRRTPGTGSSENASSAVRARIANWESSASKSSPATTTTPPAPRFRESGASAASVLMSGGGSGGGSAGVGVARRWNVRRGEDAEDVKTTLFDASSAREAITMRGYRDVLDQARDATDGAWARERAAMAVTVVTGAEDDARERRSRVARCARDDIRRVELKHSSVMASFAVRLRELKNATARLPSYDASLTTRGSSSSGSRGKDAVGTPRRKLFLTGATTATASKHVNYSATRLASRGARASSSPGEPTLTSAQRERMKIEHVDVPTLLRRVAFAALAHNAEVARAKRHAANDMSLSHRLPILQRAFDALQAHTEICKPRRDAMRAACATFVNVAKRRAKRACIRAWSRAARDGKIERASGAIHNIRVVEAALRHWELFAATRLWKRQSNALAERYAARRRKTVAFCGWLRDVRRAKERRIAVRAKLFGMSVLEAQRAVHAELRYTARDATEKLKKELKFVYDECVESAARARVASSKKLASCLRGALRFTATERDVIWASSGAGDILGLGASLKNLALGFDIPSGARRGDKKNAEALARARGDAANSRLAADIEGNEDDDDDDDDARLESSRRVDVDVVSAEAYECAREHQIALKNARDAAEKCTAARKTAHETELNASRLIANAESRANAAIQGAEDAMADSINAEYRAIEAEETARVAETRADRLAEAWAEADADALAEALRHAADAATRSLTCSSAHAAAAKVAARAAEIAEDHKDAADVIKARVRDDVDIARRNVIEAEAAVLHTAQVERQLKMKAMNAMRRLSALSEQRTSDHVVSEDKEAIRQRLTWASYGVDDDDDDEEIDVRKVSMKPGAWHTLNDVAVQVYARRLAIKAFRGFAEHVQWRAKQRAAAQLTFITHVFNAWADTARAIQTRRKRVECVIDDVMREDRERRMRLYLQCFQKHANWRRARCEELAVSLRGVMIATTRDAFEQWRLKVHRIGLCRRVINRGVVAWRERLAKPSHVGAFHRLYDALCAWRRVAHVVRERRDATSAAREYHMVTLALKCMRSWRTRAHERRQTRFARRREFDLFISARRRRVQTLILIAWRRQALKRRARILAIELYYRSLARRTLLHWRRVVIFQMGAARMRPRLALAPLAEAVVSRNSHWRRLPTT